MLDDDNSKRKSTSFLGRSYNNGRHSAAPNSAQMPLLTIPNYRIEESCIDAGITPKPFSGKVQMWVFEIESAYQFIWAGHFLPSSTNDVQLLFLVRQKFARLFTV